MDRRTLMTGMLGTAATALWTPPSAFALGLPKDKIKRIRYYKTPTDAAGRPNIHQPTFNQSTNVVTIETECKRLLSEQECRGVRFEVTVQEGEVSVRPRLIR